MVIGNKTRTTTIAYRFTSVALILHGLPQLSSSLALWRDCHYVCMFYAVSVNSRKRNDMKMKSFVVVLAVLLLPVTRIASAEPVPGTGERSRIEVSGDAVVNVRPDKVVITLGIETWNPAVLGAKEKNNDILKQTVAAARAFGVSEKQIQTGRISVEPRWNAESRKGEIDGYLARNTLQVTMNDPSKAEALVARVLQAGVNSVYGIDYQTAGIKEYRDQARELALKAAREKAEKMAAVYGQTIGRPILITEMSGGVPCVSMAAQNVVQNARNRSGAEMAAGESPVLGKIAVRSVVGVVFELK